MTGAALQDASHTVACIHVAESLDKGLREQWQGGSKCKGHALYTIASLKNLLVLTGCTPKIAHKASKGFFQLLDWKVMQSSLGQAKHSSFSTGTHIAECSLPSRAGLTLHDSACGTSAAMPLSPASLDSSSQGGMEWQATHAQSFSCTVDAGASAPLSSWRPAASAFNADGHITVEADGRVSVLLTRTQWQDLVLEQVAQHTDKIVLQEDFLNACSLREQSRSVTVLLAGTSGSGKSTLAGLLAGRLGITTVVSTDSIRHMLRSFTAPETSPLLWASTYQAGDCIEVSPSPRSDTVGLPPDAKQRAIMGYKAQSELVCRPLEQLIAACEARAESLVVEGAHLSLNFVVRLMQRHRSIIPFLVHISNEAKHRERFAVRAKYMTLEPVHNRYVQHLRPIRAIQEYLVRRAARLAIPAVDNTNVDRSVATLHATVLACLRRQARGEVLFDAASKSASAVAAEYAQVTAATWSSKGMLAVIRSKHAAAGASPSDEPSTSASSPLGPLSEAGEGSVATDGGSFFEMEELELVSSAGSEPDPEEGSDSDEEGGGTGGSGLRLDEEGSVAESEAEDQEEEDNLMAR